MRALHRAFVHLTAVCLALSATAPAFADHEEDERDHGPYGRGKYTEEFWDGSCKIERELKSDGSYKEERECKGVGEGPYRHRRGDYEQTYWDGPCKIEREWKRDGSYQEEIECKGNGRKPRRLYAPLVIAEPPWIVFERSGAVYRPGWEPPRVATAPPGRVVDCNRELIGSVIGGVAGGVLGSQIGKGSGRTAATIGGAIAGILVGGAIGREMDAQDQACIGRALETARTGQRVTWQGPAGTHYTVTPGRIERRADGLYCRGYDSVIVIDGKHKNVRGTACRQPDGVWINAN